VLAQDAPKGRIGGDRKSAKAKAEQNHGAPAHHDFNRYSTRNLSVLSARLAQEKPKFYDAYLLRDEATDVHKVLAENAPKGKPGRKKKGEEEIKL
jgi:hypothetical protein